jgi:hypothetical protein
MGDDRYPALARHVSAVAIVSSNTLSAQSAQRDDAARPTENSG